MGENESNKKANDNEYKTLDDAYIGTIKELSRLVIEQAKQLEQINISKHDTCCKCTVIAVVAAVVLCAIIFFCCFCKKCNLKVESVPDTKQCECNVSCSSATEEK
jgi:hypothetical protein